MSLNKKDQRVRRSRQTRVRIAVQRVARLSVYRTNLHIYASVISGFDRQAVGQVAAEVRALRPPEPYKGKGIRYSDEKVTIKETKKK